MSSGESSEDENVETVEAVVDAIAYVEAEAKRRSIQDAGDGAVEVKYDDIMKDRAPELGTIQFGTLLREKGNGATFDYLKFNYGPYTSMTGKGKVRGRITNQCEDMDTFKFRFCGESGNLSSDTTEYTMRVIQDTIQPFTDSYSIEKYDRNKDGIVQKNEYIQKETEEQKEAKETARKEVDNRRKVRQDAVTAKEKAGEINLSPDGLRKKNGASGKVATVRNGAKSLVRGTGKLAIGLVRGTSKLAVSAVGKVGELTNWSGWSTDPEDKWNHSFEEWEKLKQKKKKLGWVYDERTVRYNRDIGNLLDIIELLEKTVWTGTDTKKVKTLLEKNKGKWQIDVTSTEIVIRKALKNILKCGYEKPYLQKKTEYPTICLQRLIDNDEWNNSETQLVKKILENVTIETSSDSFLTGDKLKLYNILKLIPDDVRLNNKVCEHIMNTDNFNIMMQWNRERGQPSSPVNLEEYNETKDSFMGSKYEKWPVFKMDEFEEIECTINKEQKEAEKKERETADPNVKVEEPTYTLKEFIKQDYWPLSGRPAWYWKAGLKPIMRGMLSLEDMEESLNKLQDNWSEEDDGVKQNLKDIKEQCMEKMYDKLSVLRIKNIERHNEFKTKNSVELTPLERKRLALLKRADVDEYEFDIASKEVEWNLRMLDIIEKEIDELEQGQNDFDLKCAELGPDMDKSLKKWREFRKIIQENNKDCLNSTRIKQLRIMKNVVSKENNKVYNNIDAVKDSHNKDIQQTLAKVAVGVAGMFALVIGGRKLANILQGGTEETNFNPSGMGLEEIMSAGKRNVDGYNTLLKDTAEHPQAIMRELRWMTNGKVVSESEVIQYHEMHKHQRPRGGKGGVIDVENIHDNLRKKFTDIIENIRAIALVNNFEEIKDIQRERASTFTTSANTLGNDKTTWEKNIVLMKSITQKWTVLIDPIKEYDGDSVEYLSAYRFTTDKKATQAQLMIFPAKFIPHEVLKGGKRVKDEVECDIPTFEIGHIEKRIDKYFFLPDNGVEKKLDDVKPDSSEPFGPNYILTGMVSSSMLAKSNESPGLKEGVGIWKKLMNKTDDSHIHAPNKVEKALLVECKKEIAAARSDMPRIRTEGKKYVTFRVNNIMRSNKSEIKTKCTINMENSSTFDVGIDSHEVYGWSEWYLHAKKETFANEKDVIISLSDPSRPSTQLVKFIFEKARDKAMKELESTVDEGAKWSLRGFLDFTNLYHYINPQTNVSKIVFRIPMMNSSRKTPGGQRDSTYTVATRGEPIITQIPKKNCVPLTFREWALVGVEWIWDLLPRQMKEVVKSMARAKYLACKNAKEGSNERWWCIAYSAMAGAAAAVTVQRLVAGNDPMNLRTGVAAGLGGVFGGIVGYGELYGEENGPGWRRVNKAINVVKNGVGIVMKTRENIKKAIGKKIFKLIKDTFGEKYANAMVVSIYGQHVDIHSIVKLYERRGAMLQQIRRELDLLWEDERKKIDHFKVIRLFDKFFTEQIGQRNVKNEMLELYFNVIRMETETPHSKPKLALNYQFVGNPGTGKTTVATKFAEFLFYARLRGNSAKTTLEPWTPPTLDDLKKMQTQDAEGIGNLMEIIFSIKNSMQATGNENRVAGGLESATATIMDKGQRFLLRFNQNLSLEPIDHSTLNNSVDAWDDFEKNQFKKLMSHGSPHGSTKVTSAAEILLAGEKSAAGFQSMVDGMNNNGGGTIIIDEAYSLKPKMDKNGRQVYNILLLVSENYKKTMTFIAVGYPKDIQRELISFNPGMSRRFPNVILFEDFTDNEMWLVWKSMLRNTLKDNGDNTKAVHGWAMKEYDIELVINRLKLARKQPGFGNYATERQMFDRSILKAMGRLRTEAKQNEEGVHKLEKKIDEEKQNFLKQLVSEIQTNKDITQAKKDKIIEAAEKQKKISQQEVDKLKAKINDVDTITEKTEEEKSLEKKRLQGELEKKINLMTVAESKGKERVEPEEPGEPEKPSEDVIKIKNWGWEKNQVQYVGELTNKIYTNSHELQIIVDRKGQIEKELNKLHTHMKEEVERMKYEGGKKLEESMKCRDCDEKDGTCQKHQVLLVKPKFLKKPYIPYIIMEDIIGTEPNEHDPNSGLYRVMNEIKHYVGIDGIKTQLHQLIDVAKFNWNQEKNHLPTVPIMLNKLFIGKPGTGKTSIAKFWAETIKSLNLLSNGEFIETAASDFIGGAVGESQNKTSAIIKSAKGQVLFIDEAYVLAESEYGLEALNTIVEQVQATPGADLCVIMAGYTKEMNAMCRNVNPGLGRRFDVENPVLFKDYDDNALRTILKLSAKKTNVELYESAKDYAISQISKKRPTKDFGNAGTVNNFLNDAIKIAMARVLEPQKKLIKTLQEDTEINIMLAEDKSQFTAEKLVEYDRKYQSIYKTKYDCVERTMNAESHKRLQNIRITNSFLSKIVTKRNKKRKEKPPSKNVCDDSQKSETSNEEEIKEPNISEKSIEEDIKEIRTIIGHDISSLYRKNDKLNKKVHILSDRISVKIDHIVEEKRNILQRLYHELKLAEKDKKTTIQQNGMSYKGQYYFADPPEPNHMRPINYKNYDQDYLCLHKLLITANIDVGNNGRKIPMVYANSSNQRLYDIDVQETHIIYEDENKTSNIGKILTNIMEIERTVDGPTIEYDNLEDEFKLVALNFFEENFFDNKQLKTKFVNTTVYQQIEEINEKSNPGRKQKLITELTDSFIKIFVKEQINVSINDIKWKDIVRYWSGKMTFDKEKFQEFDIKQIRDTMSTLLTKLLKLFMEQPIIDAIGFQKIKKFTPQLMLNLYSLSTSDNYNDKMQTKLRRVITNSTIFKDENWKKDERRKQENKIFFLSFREHMQSIRKQMEKNNKYGGEIEKKVSILLETYVPWKYQILKGTKQPYVYNFKDESVTYPVKERTIENDRSKRIEIWFKKVYGITFFPLTLNNVKVGSVNDTMIDEIEQINTTLYESSLDTIGQLGQMLPPILLQSDISDESKKQWVELCNKQFPNKLSKNISVEAYSSFISSISPHDVNGVHWETAITSWKRKYANTLTLKDLIFEIVTVISIDAKNKEDKYNKECQQIFTQLFTFKSIGELEQKVQQRKDKIKLLNEPIDPTQDIGQTKGVVIGKINMRTGVKVSNDENNDDLMEYWVDDTIESSIESSDAKRMISDCLSIKNGEDINITPTTNKIDETKVLAMYNKHYRNLGLTLNVIRCDKLKADLKLARFVSLNLDIEDPQLVDDISKIGLLWQPQKLKLTRKDFKWTAAVDPVERLKNTLSGIEHITNYIAEKRDEFKFAVGIFGELDRSKLPTQTNLLFTGNSGTGKTTVALEMAQAFFEAGILPTSNTTVRSASDLEGTHVGEAQEIVQKTMEEAIGGLLLIDEAYELGKSEYGRQAQTKLIAMLSEEKFNNGKVVVILAGYKEDMDKMLAKNQGMASRFGKELNFKDMEPSVALNIIVELLKKDFITVSENAKEAIRIFLGTTDAKNGVMFMPGWGNFRDCKVLRNNIKQIIYSNAFKNISNLPKLRKGISEWKQKHKKQPSLEERIASRFQVLDKKYTLINETTNDAKERGYMNAVRADVPSAGVPNLAVIQKFKNDIIKRIKAGTIQSGSNFDEASVASVEVQDVIKGFGDFFLNRIPLPKKEKGMKKTEFKHGVMKTFLEKKQRCDNNFSGLWKLQTTLNTDRLSPLIQMWFREEESQSSRQSRQSFVV